MALRLTAEEKLQRLVAKCRDRVDAAQPPPQSLSHTPDSRLGSLSREAGYERLTSAFCEKLGDLLREAGVGTHPELTDPTNTRETRIHFYDLEHPLPGIQQTRVLFPTEVGLSEFLERNFAALSYVRKNGLRLRGREVRIAAGCIVDLLAEDKKTRELVGIELKHAAPDERIVAQSTKYMDALRAQAEKEGRRGARLLIVTGQPDCNLRTQVQELAATRGVPTTWLLYRLSVELSEAP